MTAIVSLWQREPAAIIGVLSAVVALAVGFGLSQVTAGAIMAVVSALSAAVVRRQVTPVAQLPPAGSIVPGVVPPVVTL